MALTRALLLLALTACLAGAQEAVHDPVHDLTADAHEPGRVALAWVAAEDSLGVRVTAHEVWRQDGTREGPAVAWTAEWVQLDALGAEAEGYVDRRVTPGVCYRYKVATQAVAADGAALPAALARRESETAGPAEALFDHYVEVVSVTAAGLEPGPEDTAKVRVHRFAPGSGAWARGPETTIAVGGEVGAEDLDGDFRTGGTLVAAMHDAGAAARVRWRTKAGETREASASDVLPKDVWTPPVKRTPAASTTRGSATGGRSGSEPKTGGDAPATTARPLPFPEPTKVGTVVGRKVLWEVSNETGYRITVYWAGPGSGQATLEPGESTVLRLNRGGTYDLSGQATDSNRIAGAEGRFSLQAGSRYRSTFRKGTEPAR